MCTCEVYQSGLLTRKVETIPVFFKGENFIQIIGCLGNGRPEKPNIKSRKKFQRLATIGSLRLERHFKNGETVRRCSIIRTQKPGSSSGN